MAQCLEVLAWARAHDGRHIEAAELLGAAQSAWQLVGVTLPGVGRLLHRRTAREVLVGSRLGESRLAMLRRSGAALDIGEVLARALGRGAEPGDLLSLRR
ncbi:hypothetical protein ACFCYM_29365 [Streptomyces sp. NPDC056254]|uniref:hypothetical protein n=1 Tax=Streptomyces sp. NPDC056254 TaxID=3345763 RepID=UPI0035E1CE4A